MEQRTRWIVTGLFVSGSLLGMASVSQTDPGGLPECKRQLTTCTTDLEACEAEPNAIIPGDGQEGTALDYGLEHGPAFSYTDNGDGTFTDNNTQLMWEKKDDSGGVHDKDNLYTWGSTGPEGSTEPEPTGTLFTDFLATLNTAPCFAGHCDWRIPNVKELQSLVDYSTFSPAVNGAFPGPTAPNIYWSSTSNVGPFAAWVIGFFNGNVFVVDKSDRWLARAVRGDL